MKADTLDATARRRALVRSLIADLRHLGCDDNQIRKCRTVVDLDKLKARFVADTLMAAPSGR